MDPFEALGDHCFYAQKTRALRRPVARTARAVFLSRDYHERYFSLLILHGGIVNAHTPTIRIMDRHTTFDAWDHKVFDSDVGKSPTDHHLVVSATRPVTIEVSNADAF